MKLFTISLLFCLLTSTLFAQNQSLTKLPPLKKAKSNEEWMSGVNVYFGLNSTYTEGGLKDFIASPMSFNVGFEIHTPHVFALTLTPRIVALKQTFTNNNHVWLKDTTISFTTVQGSFGYQFWQSKHTALYLFGALGVHSLSAGKSPQKDSNGNCIRNCEAKDKEWTLISVAPSTGFFLDFRQKRHPKISGSPTHNSYWRLRFAANPTRFRHIGYGVFYDMGVAYVL
jgi:hypothetical protein